jgi:hypothetical protein
VIANDTELRAATAPVRFSNLKQMSRSALHYQHSVESGWDDTRSFRVGRIAHRYVTGVGDVHVYRGIRRGKEWDAFRADKDPDSIINEAEYAESQGIAEAMLRHPDAMRYLKGDFVEHKLTWKKEGIACQGTPDVFTDAFVTDIKSTKCSEPGKFTRDGLWYGYHAQLAWYQEGVQLSRLGKPRDAFIVAVESKLPHPITVLQLTERAIDKGQRLCRLWWEQLRVCMRENHWPPYVQSVVPFDVPDDDEFTLMIDGEEVAA